MYVANTTNTDPIAAAMAAAGTNAAGTNASAATNSNNQLGPDAFLQLLSAQLENQTPDSAVDPNQMMTELVQFNSLEQLISINQDLQQQTSQPPAPTGSAAPGASAAGHGAAAASGVASASGTTAGSGSATGGGPAGGNVTSTGTASTNPSQF
ncbi:MAG: flagellar hook capping FlgD N-terminal domain-containing protein [Terriglobales bacterium]